MNNFKVALLLSYISVASLSAAIITPALPQIQMSFSLSHGTLEWVITTFLLGYMVGQLIYGPLANRYGSIAALRLGFSVNMVGILICLISVSIQSFSLLIFGRLVTALGAAAGLSCTFILINELLDENQRKHALFFAVVSFTLGIGLAVLVGGLVTQYLTWSFCFWLLLLHGIAMFVSTWVFQVPAKTKAHINFASIRQSYAAAFQNRKLVVFSLLLGFVSVISYCYSAAGPIIAQRFLNLTPSQYGYWNILCMAGMLSGGISASVILKRYSMTHTIFMSLTMIAVALISLFIQASLELSDPLLFFATITFLYFFASWIFPCASYYASNAISDKASASSAMNFINMSAAVVSVAIMGYLPVNRFMAFNVIIAIFLIVVIVCYALWRQATEDYQNHLAN